MTDLVTLNWPSDGVALVTMTNPAINNHGSWEGIYALWQALVEARESGARVSVLASGVPGHWFEHAWLRDLSNMFQGKETSGPPDGWFGCLDEVSKTPVVSMAAIGGYVRRRVRDWLGVRFACRGRTGAVQPAGSAHRRRHRAGGDIPAGASDRAYGGR